MTGKARGKEEDYCNGMSYKKGKFIPQTVSLKPGVYIVRRNTQTLLRKRLYADTRVKWFVLLHRSVRVFTQTYAIAVCVLFQGDRFILYPA